MEASALGANSIDLVRVGFGSIHLAFPLVPDYAFKMSRLDNTRSIKGRMPNCAAVLAL